MITATPMNTDNAIANADEWCADGYLENSKMAKRIARKTNLLANDGGLSGRPCMSKGRTKMFSKTFALVY